MPELRCARSRLDKLKRAPRHAHLRFMSLAFANAEIAFELRAGVYRCAASNLAQDTSLLEVVEVAVDRHLGNGKAIRKILEIDVGLNAPNLMLGLPDL